MSILGAPCRGQPAADDIRALAPSRMIPPEQEIADTYAATGGRKL